MHLGSECYIISSLQLMWQRKNFGSWLAFEKAVNSGKFKACFLVDQL